jgi:hypothetical protein
MKKYTSESQTAKLIELGFEKPSNTIVKEEPIYREGSIIDWKPIAEEGAYSIGELIEMLPPRYNHEDLEINRDWRFERWLVFYRGDDTTAATELIDALYDMVVKLKEEGVYENLF